MVTRMALKPWHKPDVEEMLRRRGWDGPSVLAFPSEWWYCAEAWEWRRADQRLKLYVVADYGTGFLGLRTLEAIEALREGSDKLISLWLHRTRNAKWKKELIEWADRVSGVDVPPLRGLGVDE